MILVAEDSKKMVRLSVIDCWPHRTLAQKLMRKCICAKKEPKREGKSQSHLFTTHSEGNWSTSVRLPLIWNSINPFSGPAWLNHLPLGSCPVYSECPRHQDSSIPIFGNKPHSDHSKWKSVLISGLFCSYSSPAWLLHSFCIHVYSFDCIFQSHIGQIWTLAINLSKHVSLIMCISICVSANTECLSL